VETRREQQNNYLSLYLTALKSQGVPATDLGRDEAETDLMLMTLLLFFYSWLLDQTGQVGEKQGNTASDVKEWGDRVQYASFSHST
jgi:hypothetical protein